MLEYILDKLDRLLKEVERMSITEYNEFYTKTKEQIDGGLTLDIFDFDVTLCCTDSKVIKTNADGTIQKLSSTEFNNINDSTLDKSSLDFSEFHELINPKVNEDVLQAFRFSLKNSRVIILTARQSSIPIREFLTMNNLPQIPIYCDEFKREFIENIILSGTTSSINFFEDAPNYIRDARLLQRKYPNFNLNIHETSLDGFA